jgi:hypothetical protein
MERNTGRVVTPLHAASGLLKASWTSRDYSAMAWHGCTIHAINIGKYEDNRGQILDDQDDYLEFDDLDDTVPWDFMLLDIDYIVNRAGPAPAEREPSYWIAPATLAFTRASDIIATISDGPSGPLHLGLGTATTTLVIADVHRIEPEGKWDPQWHITGNGFDIRLQDAGFRLYIRTPPQLVTRPFLGTTERGGVSFVQQAFA